MCLIANLIFYWDWYGISDPFQFSIYSYYLLKYREFRIHAKFFIWVVQNIDFCECGCWNLISCNMMLLLMWNGDRTTCFRFCGISSVKQVDICSVGTLINKCIFPHVQHSYQFCFIQISESCRYRNMNWFLSAIYDRFNDQLTGIGILVRSYALSS